MSDNKIINLNKEYFNEAKGFCLSCETIAESKATTFDVVVTDKLTIYNLEGECCIHCDEAVLYSDDAIEKIEQGIARFKDDRIPIEMLLPTTREESYRWCESGFCACAGAANCSMGLSSYLYTKVDWINWKENFPQSHTKLFTIFLSGEVRMSLILAIKNIFHIGAKDAANFVTNSYAVIHLDYDYMSEEDINSDLKELEEAFGKKNISLDKKETEYDHLSDEPIYFLKRT